MCFSLNFFSFIVYSDTFYNSGILRDILPKKKLQIDRNLVKIEKPYKLLHFQKLNQPSEKDAKT